MKKSDLKNLMKKYDIVSYADTCDFVSDLLAILANEINEEEPYAVNTIKEYKKASYRVFDLVNEIEEILEGEEK